MIRFDNLSIRRGEKLLFDHATAQINPGSRVGILGANGTGKSSLFQSILGHLEADSGEIQIPGQWTVAHVAQETPALDISALEYVLMGDREYFELRQKLNSPEHQHDAQLHEQMTHIDGYRIEARAARMLSGLGFSNEQLAAAVRTFSGGWRMRLNLAQALICRSNLLLLDEPTNHLDLDAVLWLAAWLKSYEGTLLLISHDRDLLDDVCSHILALENQKVALYTGNLSQYERARAEQRALLEASYAKQQQQKAHLQSFVDRFRAKATKARQAQSRIKALEKMQDIELPPQEQQFEFHIPSGTTCPNPLLQFEDARVGYGDKIILDKITLRIGADDRIGLLGPNGAGKSTLIKLLAGDLQALQGKRTQAQGLRIAYFAQHQLEQLKADQSPLQHLQALSPDEKEQVLRDFIGKFGFSGDRALQPVAPLSGGEKARLVLAMLAWQRPNLLLLDEPTNHLDMGMRTALSIALQDFEGAVVIISHDRHLLRSCCNDFLLVGDGKIQPYSGDLEDYRQHLLSSQTAESATPAASDNNRKAQRQKAAEIRQQLQPLKKQMQQAEQMLEKQQSELQVVENQLSDSDLYTNPSRKSEMEKLSKRAYELKQAIESSENAWMEACEQYEQAQAQLQED